MVQLHTVLTMKVSMPLLNLWNCYIISP